MYQYKKILWLTLSCLLLVFAVAGCQMSVSTDDLANAAVASKRGGSFESQCVALGHAMESRIGSGELRRTTAGLNGDFTNTALDGNLIQDQVIISGGDEAMDNLVGFYEIEELFAVPYYDAADPNTATGEIRLYQLDPGTDVYRFIQEFNRTAVQEMGGINDTTPFAEPNLVVHGPESPFVDTGGSGGKNTILGTGGKNTILGTGPDALFPLAVDSRNAAGEFSNQWAFSQIGLMTNGQRNTTQNGDGVNIVVFDTSPMDTFGLQTIEWAAEPYELCNHSVIDTFGDGAQDQKGGSGDLLQNHGLFVSGLSQAIAPASQIHLVQVLNDNMTGNLFTLLNGIDLFAQAQLETSGPQKTVFNMSLVISPARDFTYESGDHETQTAQERYIDELVAQGCDPTSVAMCRSINRYNSMGYVMVAAAGNLNLSETQYPASDARVIGVSGTTESGEKACFANAGEVAAPAGNGLFDASAQTCDLRLAQVCPTSEICDSDGIRMIVSLAHPDTGYESGYVQWVGTSFAAPQVSGLAALSFAQQPDGQDFSVLQAGATQVSSDVMSGAVHIIQPPIPEIGSGVAQTGGKTP